MNLDFLKQADLIIKMYCNFTYVHTKLFFFLKKIQYQDPQAPPVHHAGGELPRRLGEQRGAEAGGAVGV